MRLLFAVAVATTAVVALLGWGSLGSSGVAIAKPTTLWRSDGTLPEEVAVRFKTMILLSGYQCPSVNGVRPRGLFPEGDAFKVYCGPAAGGVYDKLVYWVALQSRQVKKCSDEPRC
jgi:hypothetical protein